MLCAKIFNSLNAQDLPEFFEDNLNVWMPNFIELLSLDDKLLGNEADDEPGPLQELKSEICENASQYASKYSEEFTPYLPNFVDRVWNLLTTTPSNAKYDILVCNAIQFLNTISERPANKHLFETPTVLDALCSKVIVPNMEFRSSDEEMFEDNPEEYIRRDIEGSDVDTRRRVACELVKSLTRYFEQQVVQVFGNYVQTMLANFQANPSQQWKSKDAAIYLVTSISVRGQTARQGSTSTSSLVNIVDFYQNFILPDLQRPDIDSLPVLRADALKYIMTFRSMLPFEAILLPSIPLIIQHLHSQSIVVHSYAALAIERLLTVRNPSNSSITLVRKEHIKDVAAPLLKGLFGIFDKQGSAENDYAMKAIMRTLSLLQSDILSFLEDILPKFTSKVVEVAKNPSKPQFNHYLFESLVLTVKVSCTSNQALLASFEGLLFPIFEHILVNDVQEFMPYVFQIMSLMLELQVTGAVAPIYMNIFPMLVVPVLWERPANISPLVRLLQAFIEKAGNQILATKKLDGLLGVYQKLLSSKANDHEGFYLIQSIITHIDFASLSDYMKTIFLLQFNRLTNSKTTKFVRSMIVFLSLFICKHSLNELIRIVNSIQNGIFGMMIEKLYVADAQKITEDIDKKLCVVAMTKILCEDTELISGSYQRQWPYLFSAVVNMFVNPPDDTIPEDEHFVEIDVTSGYQAGYSQLRFGEKKEIDPLENEVPNPQVYFIQSIHGVCQRHANLKQYVNLLHPDVMVEFKKMLVTANVHNFFG